MKKHMTGAARLSAMVTGMMMAWQVAATQPKELNLGILGGQNATQQIDDNQCVKAFLNKEPNMDTKLHNSSDYFGVIQGLLGSRIGMMPSIFPSSYASVYISGPKVVGIVSIAVDDKDQPRGHHPVVIVKADPPYKTLGDLKGKAFGFADPGSTSGYPIPNHALKEKFGGDTDNKYSSTFSSVTLSGGYKRDILGVLNGQLAGAVTWISTVGDYNTGYTTGAFNRLIRMDYPDLMKQIRVTWQSPPILNGLILISNVPSTDSRAKVVAAAKELDIEDHACFVKTAGGTQHISSGSVVDFQQIIDMKCELVSARQPCLNAACLSPE